MKKRVLLLAVSCKNGGLCPGGIDLDNPNNWIRVVRDDGMAGAVQGYEIDFAEPLDIIEFDGRAKPQGKQLENWVIDNNSCKNQGRAKLKGSNESTKDLVDWAFGKYGYHGFWNNYKAYLDEDEFASINVPSESILKVSDVRIYKNDFKKVKIDFQWSGALYKVRGVSVTDQTFYDRLDDDVITLENAYVVISIPKEIDFVHSTTGEKRAYKFVSKIFEI